MYSIFIVGCGATGSQVAQNVSQFAVSEKKISKIVLIDFDTVEVKNFRNQRFTLNDIDKNKARVLASRYKKLNINICYYEEKLEEPKRMIEIINENTEKYSTPILVSCVDNNKARQVLHEVFYSEEVLDLLYIDTGNGDGNNRYGQTVCGAKKNNNVVSPPVGDIYPEILEEEIKEEIKEDYTCSNIEEHPQSFATNILSSTVVFIMINNIVSLEKIGRANVRFSTDLIAVN